MSRYRPFAPFLSFTTSLGLVVALASGACGGGEDPPPAAGTGGESPPVESGAAAPASEPEGTGTAELLPFDESPPVALPRPEPSVSGDFDRDRPSDETASVETRIDDRGEEVVVVSVEDVEWTLAFEETSGFTSPSLAPVSLLPARPPLLWLQYGQVCGAPCTYSYAHLLLPVDGDGLREVWSEEVGYFFGEDDSEEATVDLREGWVSVSYGGLETRYAWSGQRQVVLALLEAGADPTMGVGVEGEETAAELAEEAGHAGVAEVIRQWAGR